MICPNCRKDVGAFRHASKIKACVNCGQVVMLGLDGIVRSPPYDVLKKLPVFELNEIERDQMAVRRK